MRSARCWRGLLLGALVAVSPLAAARAADPPRQVVLQVARDYLAPRYQALQAATQAQVAAWATCPATPAQLARLRQAFGAVADAWAGVQHVHFGPATLELRVERFYFWPDPRNMTQRGLDALLASDKPLAGDALRTESVAVQGLPAMERLLHGDGAEAALAPGAAGVERRCALGRALAQGQAQMADGIVSLYMAPDGVIAALEGPGALPGLFDDPDDAGRRILTDLMTLFQIVSDQKLIAVLGTSVEKARPRQAELWRSGRSARMLRLSLDSGLAMYRALAPSVRKAADGPATDRAVEEAFAAAIAAAAALPDDLGAAAADPAQRPKLEATQAAVKHVRDVFGARVPAALGIILGFNALDGD
ncbi:imelysin family protein [Zavarzinia sp. CC-PAN008]|uniref:imelysin family protein n=1 Tax=Zavarzinia sp. CC-PAN008 TaxID=3243332 RepID=UPI003F7474CE